MSIVGIGLGPAPARLFSDVLSMPCAGKWPAISGRLKTIEGILAKAFQKAILEFCNDH
jgi:hypothetical protein